MKNYALAIAMILMGSSLWAQKTFADYDQKDAKKRSKTPNWRNDRTGGGYGDLTDHSFQTIALVGFTLDVKADFKKIGRVMSGRSASQTLIDEITDDLYAEVSDDLISSFAADGKELLLYEDMTANQQAAIQEVFNANWVPGMGAQEFFDNLEEAVTSGTAESGVGIADNYPPLRVAPLILPKVYPFYDELREKLGVDAILIVSSDSEMDWGKEIIFTGFHMQLLGENPMTLEEGLKGKPKIAQKILKNNYWPTVPYSQLDFRAKKDITIIEFDGDEIGSKSLDGAGKVYGWTIPVLMEEYYNRAK